MCNLTWGVIFVKAKEISDEKREILTVFAATKPNRGHAGRAGNLVSADGDFFLTAEMTRRGEGREEGEGMDGMTVLLLFFRAPARNLGFVAGDLSLAVEMTLGVVGTTAGEVEISVLEAQQPFGIAVKDARLGVG